MAHESNTRQVSDRSTEDRARGYAPPSHHLAAIAASVAAHALILFAIVFLAARAAPQGHHWVLAYVIDLGAARGVGGDSGGSIPARLDPGPASPPQAAPPVPRTPHRLRKSHRTRASLPTPPIEADPIERADDVGTDGTPSTPAAPSSGAKQSETAGPHTNSAGSDNGSGGQGGGRGDGVGSGAGDGTGSMSVARADYDSDPAPLYPARSRRRGEQGTVTLHVLIAASGAVERVELIESSGFRDLDEAALDTVRSRWRFVPARRDGIAFESWAVVPIRFALTEASN